MLLRGCPLGEGGRLSSTFGNNKSMQAEEKVTIDLTKKQLTLLAESMAIAHWIVCAGEDFDDRPYRDSVDELEQIIYSQALSHGLSNIINTHDDDGSHYLRFFCEDGSKPWEAVEAYDNETFWAELISRYSRVLAERELGHEGYINLSREKRIER